MDILLEEYKRLLLLLLKHNVNFMLIGGYAVIFYGYERLTSDMDVWIKPDNTNRDKLIEALKEFGIRKEDIETISTKDFTELQFFYFGAKPCKIDFLTKIAGVSYEEASSKANSFPLKDKMVPIIQYHHLILSKICNDRLKDKIDVEELQKINKERPKPF